MVSVRHRARAQPHSPMETVNGLARSYLLSAREHYSLKPAGDWGAGWLEIYGMVVGSNLPC